VTHDVIEQVALVSGRILHRGTGLPIEGAVSIDAAEGPVRLKVLTDGRFALSADPHAFLAQLAANSIPLTLTLRAQSRTFTQGVVTETIALTAVPPFPDEQADWKIPSGANAIAANLKRTIRGRVIEAEDPAPAIAGAGVGILHAGKTIAPVATDADGRFSFDDVVVEGPAEIRVEKADFVIQKRQLWIDFTLGSHEEHFRLMPEPEAPEEP
jgi:hypothetical protein